MAHLMKQEPEILDCDTLIKAAMVALANPVRPCHYVVCCECGSGFVFPPGGNTNHFIKCLEHKDYEENRIKPIPL
jgi:hypothetical protein